MLETLDAHGFAIVEAALPGDLVRDLVAAIEAAKGVEANLRNVREAIPEMARAFLAPGVGELAAAVLGDGAFVVRGLLFDKNPAANWKVPWHQDLTIAVREKREVAGFGPWSVKAGIPHVQPPAAILERMIALRLHLDDCGAENGALKVLPGSHRAGKLSPAEIQEWRKRVAQVTCAVARGGVLLIRPLLLHASAPATAPAHRRVLHLEFAAEELPGGLEWFETLQAPARKPTASAEDGSGP